jgi:integrase
MGRRRKAWLVGGNGRRTSMGRLHPGYYARYTEFLPDGRKLDHWINFRTAGAAREWVKQYNARSDLQQLDQVIPIAISAAGDLFGAGMTARAHDTVVHYANAIGLLSAVIGDIQVCNVTGHHIDAFIASRCAVSSASTVAKHCRSLRRFFNWCIQHSYHTCNPVRQATALPRSLPREKPVVTEAQLAAILDALDTEDRKLAVWLAMTTGLDRHVIEQLCTSQVDLEHMIIHHRRPKTGRVYSVPIHPLLAPLLARRLSASLPKTALLSGLSRQHRTRDWWHLAMERAGLPGFQFRYLRAVATTRLMRQGGATLRDAQALLGHASPQTTAAHYNMPDPSIVASLQRLPLPGLPDAPEQKTQTPSASCPPQSAPPEAPPA